MTDRWKGWSVAYHFHSDKDLTITQAMKLRQGNDPRAGDLHCHRDCYFGNTGDRLITVQASNIARAYFRRSKSKTNTPSPQSQCNRFSIKSSKRETMDYAQYFFQFEEYLGELIGKGKPYIISSVERGKGVGKPDFILGHGKNEWGLSKTFVTIIDENKRRNRRLKSYNQSNTADGRNINIIIVISEYTVAQLHDFKRGGIEKFEIFWEKTAREYEILRCEEYYDFEIPDDVLRHISFEKIKDAFEDEEQRMDHQAAIEEAINRNVEKYRMEGQQKKFSSPEEVDIYYENQFGEDLKRRNDDDRKWRILERNINQKQDDFEKKEGVSLVGTFYKIEDLNDVIRKYQQFRELIVKEIKNVIAHFESYKENKDSYSSGQGIIELKQIEDEIKEIASKQRNFSDVRGLEDEELQDIWHEVYRERSNEKTKLTSEYQEYKEWWEKYREAVAKFFILAPGLSITKKVRKKLNSLTEYWLNLDWVFLVAQLTENKVLQYDVSTRENLLKVPIKEILTPEIDLWDIAEKDKEKKEKERIQNEADLQAEDNRRQQRDEARKSSDAQKKGRDQRFEEENKNKKIGKVKKWIGEKGYGFVTCDGIEYFLHINELEGTQNKKLDVGHTVAFNVKKSTKGPKAVDVVIKWQ
jgi:cold shock protein